MSVGSGINHDIRPGDPQGSPAAGQWSAVLGLGSACAIAYHLHRRGLAKRTGPLDWFGSRNVDTVAHLVRTRFATLFMDRHQIEVVGEHNRYWKVMDTGNVVFTLHDFPMVGRKPKPLWRPPLGERLKRFRDRLVEPAWRWRPGFRFDGPDGSKIPLPGYPEFRRRIARRVARFAAALESPEPVLVIRRAREEREAMVLHAALADIRKEKPTRLLILGYEEAYAKNWGVPGLRTAVMPSDDPTQTESWRGRDIDWDRLFEGCRLIEG